MATNPPNQAMASDQDVPLDNGLSGRTHDLASETDSAREPVSPELLAQFITLSSQAFAIGYPDGSLGFVNEAFENLTGYTAKELRTISWETTLTPPEWREFERKKVEELNQTGIPTRYEKEYIRKDGTRVPIELHVHRVPDPDGQLYYFSFLTDISERKQKDRELQLSEDRFRTILANASDCIFRYNYKIQRYDYASPSSEEILDITVDEFLSMSLESAIKRVHPDDRQRLVAAMSSLTPGQRLKIDYRQIGKNNEYHWVSNHLTLINDDQGQPLYRYGNIRDITREKEIELSLRESDERFRGVLDTSLDMIYRYVYDSRGYDYVSPSCERVLGFTVDQMLSMSAEDTMLRIHPDDLESIHTALVTLVEAGELDFEYRYKVDGDYRWLFNRSTIAYNDEGKPKYRCGAIRDITERKQIEQELAQVSEAVQKSLLLAPKSDVYSGIVTHPFYQSASDLALIGGDFFDIFPISENNIALIVGDATGKGVQAATYTAEIKFALRAYLRSCNGDLSTAVSLLNKFICDNILYDSLHLENCYTALAAAVIDTKCKTISCVCAGSEPPIILSSQSGETSLACGYGPLLGVSSESTYQTSHCQLESGDLIAMTTDGITEAHVAWSNLEDNHLTGYFGIERVEEILCSYHPALNTSLETIQTSIVESALVCAGDVQRDDICILMARIV